MPWRKTELTGKEHAGHGASFRPRPKLWLSLEMPPRVLVVDRSSILRASTSRFARLRAAVFRQARRGFSAGLTAFGYTLQGPHTVGNSGGSIT